LISLSRQRRKIIREANFWNRARRKMKNKYWNGFCLDEKSKQKENIRDVSMDISFSNFN
jgi:hypothetical protein